MRYQRYWVGLDAGVTFTAICLVNGDGKVLHRGIVDTNAFQVQDILRRFGVEAIQLITIESGVGIHMVRQLLAWRYPVQVVDVRRSSKFLGIHRQKTDTNDAQGLAELGRLGRSISGKVFVKPLDCQNIRTLLSIRRGLVKHRARTEALLQSVVRTYGGNLSIRSGIDGLAVEMATQKHWLEHCGLNIEADIQPLVALARDMRIQIHAMSKRLATFAREHPVCSNLMTIPGVGPITALSFMSAIGDPHRFHKSSNVGAYLGLTPHVRQSGNTSRVGRISRFGNKMTRGHLVSAATAALSASKAESSLQVWGRNLAQRIGPSKARIAVARKLAVLMLSMWKSGAEFDPHRKN